MVSKWPKLVEMDLSGNPVCSKKKYRDHLTIVCKNLGMKATNEFIVMNECSNFFFIFISYS